MDSSFSPTCPEDKQENQSVFAVTSEQKRITCEWALYYISPPLNWEIVHAWRPILNSKGKPICSCPKRGACIYPGKHPVPENGFLSASKDPELTRERFTLDGLLYNIFVRTGEGSGITVYDIDCGKDRSGKQKVGMQSWLAACGDHGEPATLLAKTGSGGFHYFFRYNAAIPTKSDFLGKGSHVDVKNDGGGVILTPSLHVTGGVYEWVS